MPMTECEKSRITANFYLAIAGSCPAQAKPFSINLKATGELQYRSCLSSRGEC